MPSGAPTCLRPAIRRALFLAVALGLSGCAQTGGKGLFGAIGAKPELTADAAEQPPEPEKFDPRNLQKSLELARTLKASGDRAGALAVLQQTAQYHGDSRELASEYGRLAADLDQIGLAHKLLAKADDPQRPDWRVLSARGVAFAKEGRYAEAAPYFERALALAPGNPAVTNNLAMVRAAQGDRTSAETLIRQAGNAAPADNRIRGNLALIAQLGDGAARPQPAVFTPEPARVAPPVQTVRAEAPRPQSQPPAAVAARPAASAPTPLPVAPAPRPEPSTNWQTAMETAPAPTPAPTPAPRSDGLQYAPLPPSKPAQGRDPVVNDQFGSARIAPVAASPAPAKPVAVSAGWTYQVEQSSPEAETVVQAAPPPAVELPSNYWRPLTR